jgi:thiosulfate/3-mercaptopyruvate sulfurtransferase
MSNFVETAWLVENRKLENLVIIDARNSPTDTAYGEQQYEKNHIEKAIYVNISELVSEDTDYGGAKPIPYPNELADYFASIGIDGDSTVVIYDDYVQPESARIWWLLKFIGHSKAYVLNGGYTKWVKDGYPVTKEVPTLHPKQYQANPQWERALKKLDIEQIVNLESAILIDARDQERFLGDPGQPGHIPTAQSYYWKNHFNDHNLKPLEEIKRNLSSKYKLEDEIVLYCGLGISACINYLVFDEAGYQNLKLYPGSWSDWIDTKAN